MHGSGGRGRVSEDDAVILECWAQFKETGFGPDQGIRPADLRMYDEAMAQLVAREARIALAAYTGHRPRTCRAWSSRSGR